MIAVVRLTDQPVTRTVKYSGPEDQAGDVIDEGEGEAPQHSVNFGARRGRPASEAPPGALKRLA